MPYALMRIPFYFNRVFTNFSKTQGLVGINKSRIELEYSNMNYIFGNTPNEMEKIVIPMDEVTHFTISPRGKYMQIRIGVKSPEFIENFPNTQNGEIKVNVKKRFQRMVNEVNVFLKCRIRELNSHQLLEAPAE